MDGAGLSFHGTDAVPVLERVRRRVSDELKPQADRIDREGHYPVDALRGFGADGAYALHLAGHTPLAAPSLWAAIDAVGAIGAGCMSSAFCAWCQDACGWYLENTANTALRVRLQGGIASGALMGATGLSNPVKALSGIEPFNLRGTRVPGGWRVNGVLPWVSNLGEGHVFGTIFQAGEDPAHKVMGMFTSAGRTG